MEPLRIRVVFEDGLLTEYLKSAGLKRCWILLDFGAENISDIASFLLNNFNLPVPSSDALILSMVGFVLPPFESTRIFKDKDIIRVKKNELFLLEELVTENQANSPRVQEILGKQHEPQNELLAMEEFEEETGGYESEPEETNGGNSGNALCVKTASGGEAKSKKRKSSKKLQSEKKKIKRSSPQKDQREIVNGFENDGHKELQEGFQSTNGVPEIRKKSKRSSPQKDQKRPVNEVEDDDHKVQEEEPQGTDSVPGNMSHKKSKPSKKIGKSKKVSAAEVDNTVKNNAKSKLRDESKSSKKIGKSKRISAEADDMVKIIPKFVLSDESSDDLQENGTKSQEVAAVSESMKKTSSRSARRKKAKRKWLREQEKTEKEMVQSQLPEKNVNKIPQEHVQIDDGTDKEPTEIAPVVVRPGHIRFEPLDEDEVIQRSQAPVESFQWNGTTSKKKGQKWGKEKTSASRSNDNKRSWEETVEKQPPVEVRKHVPDPIDFEKLELLPGFPKEGDVVAYRVVELSSSWCPELSPFRVGKVSAFDSASNRVLLLPVPEYPIVSEEDQDETLEVDNSLYNADGSLEIDFAALVGVRVVKHDGSATVVTSLSEEAAVTTKEAAAAAAPVTTKEANLNNGNGNSNSRVLENGGPSHVWEEFSKELDAKKTQLLSEKQGWNKKESPRSSSWSYRAMRSSALGPTMSLLRSGNGSNELGWNSR